MTQFYIGVKQIEAWELDKDGIPGYAVRYPDGYESWSPKAVFEAAYLPMGVKANGTVNNNSITEKMVESFIANHESQQWGPKTTLVKAELVNGYVITESSACVDPANFSMEIGEGICKDRIRNKVWELLGFLLQTARNGVK